ncbi:MAG: hypothetical protein QJR14_08645 [Bacillota bacterium]|nr:hypothetical protein [Bacillota bacterium]
MVARLLGLAIWVVAAPFVAMALASLAMMLLPLPSVLWGMLAALVSVGLVDAVPFLILLEARRAGDRVGQVAGAAVTGWSTLAVLLVFVAFPARTAIQSGRLP